LYIGTKPNNYIFGLEELKKQFNKNIETETNAAQYNSDYDDATGEDENNKLDSKKIENKAKISEVILCSGDRDALNVASLGYFVLWLNSETTYISFDDYKDIKSKCKDFYNIPDIDETGCKMGHKFALNFLDCKTIWLPETLKAHKDFRGNPCKDITDYLKHFTKRDFDWLKSTALPLKFWSEQPKFDKSGNFRGTEYVFNNTTAYEYLNANGFYRYESKNDKDGYFYVKIEQNNRK